MTTLVIGASGMLGQALLPVLRAAGHDTVSAARHDTDTALDLANDQSIQIVFDRIAPNLVINCAAITSVEECEIQSAAAWRTNARAVSILANHCINRNARFVQISTDHFFSGDGSKKHREDSPVKLLNNYARTKFAGEAFAQTCPNALVVRTNIVGFRDWATTTFIEEMIENIKNRARIRLFTDAFVSSMDVGSAAAGISKLIERDASGVINLGSRDVFSKKALIEKLAERFGLPLHNAEDGSVHSLRITRPDSLGLDVSRAESILGYALPSLADVVDAVFEEHTRRTTAT